MFGEAGNDRMIWNPGDDTDLIEGGAGTDTAEVNGGNGAEVFTVTANGTRVRFDRVDPGAVQPRHRHHREPRPQHERRRRQLLRHRQPGRADQLTVDGGAGNDTILGGNGADILLGGDGNDFIDGKQGNDIAFLGAGNDMFQWDPGDGSDTVEGQDGTDTMLFNGSDVDEIFDVSANGERVRFTRNVGNIVMDLNDVEKIDFNALGGADTITVNDLTGTDVTEVDVDLAGTIGGTPATARPTRVIVNGTNGDDIDRRRRAGTAASSVVGLAALVNVTDSEGANDALVVNGAGRQRHDRRRDAARPASSS